MTTITRRIVKPASSNSGGTYSESASNNTFQSNQNEYDDRDKDDERDNDDDKETRLTLMEEVLLLGLKDREVCSFEFKNEKKKLDFFIFFFLRVIHHSGMIVYHLVYVVVS
jgi:hypothetical protein